MNQQPSPTHVRRLATPARLFAAAGICVAGTLAAAIPSASASEFYGNPTLSIISGCKADGYHYQIGLYNFGATDGTEFTVTVSDAGNPSGTTVHDLAAGGLEWLDYTIPEGQIGTFHVTSSDGKVDDLRTPRPDCVPDPEATIAVICASDGSASLHYDYSNTSYTSTHFVALLPDGSSQESDSAWGQQMQHIIDVPVAEGQHVTGAVSANGIAYAEIDTTIDCIADVTTTTVIDSTVPDTTLPGSDVPDPTIPAPSVPGATVPVTVVPGENLPNVTVPSQPIPARPTVVSVSRRDDVTLPETGQSHTPLLAVAGASLLAGFALIRTTRRPA